MDGFVELLRMFLRRYRLLLALLVLLAAGATAGVYLKRPAYDASAKLLINLDGAGISLSRADVQRGSTHVQVVEAITSQVEILQTRELVVKAIDQLGAQTFDDPPPSLWILRIAIGIIRNVQSTTQSMLEAARLAEPIDPRNLLIESVTRGLQVSPVRQAQIIVVTFRWHNPRTPPLVLNTILDLYLSKVGEINGQSDGYELYVEQVQRVSDELTRAERDLRDLELRYDITDLRREKQLLLDRIEKLTNLAESTSNRQADTASQRLALYADNGEGAFVVGAQIAQLRAQLTALTVERAKSLISYTQDHPRVRELDTQIAAIEEALARETTLLSQTLASNRERMRTLQAVESEFNRVSRNLEIATEAYQTYRKVSEDRRVMKAQQARVRVQVVDPPSTPFRPSGPSRLTLLLIGLGLSLVVAAMLVFILDWLTASFRSASALPQSGRPLPKHTAWPTHPAAAAE